MLRYTDDRNGCEVCYCDEPCYGYECPPEHSCAVEKNEEDDTYK